MEDNLETPQQYKERWRSIYIVYFTMFLISLGFSIVVTGVWPYLNKLDPSAGKEFLGFVVAANPFGQMIFSPLVGLWSNKLGSIRLPLIMSLVLFTFASGIYSSLELFTAYRKYWMFLSRFLVGVSSANVAACRSYVSAATRLSERTKAVSMISLAQVLGFVVGPAVQAAVVPLGHDGVWIVSHSFKLNMYTAAGWINALLSLVNVYLFLPSVFHEYKIAAKEAMLRQGTENEKDTWKNDKPSYVATWTLIVAFFVIVFNFMLLETLGTPLTMDQFAWSNADSLKYMGILMSIGAVMAIATFASIAPLTKKFCEVKVMIIGGFLFMVLGRVMYIPFAGDPPKMFNNDLRLNLTIFCDNLRKNVSFSDMGKTIDFRSMEEVLLSDYNKSVNFLNVNFENMKKETMNCGLDLLGCPSNQVWCNYTPAMTLAQFIIGYLLTAFGYPIGVTLIQTLFSNLLGSRPQGVWMGLITGSGCLSRVMGPVFVTYIYEVYGTVWTFSFTSVMMLACFIWLYCFRKRLVPVERGRQELGQELRKMDSVS